MHGLLDLEDITDVRIPRDYEVNVQRFQSKMEWLQQLFPPIGELHSGFRLIGYTAIKLKEAKDAEDQGDFRAAASLYDEARRIMGAAARGFIEGSYNFFHWLLISLEENVPTDVLSNKEMSDMWDILQIEWSHFTNLAKQHERIDFEAASHIYLKLVQAVSPYLEHVGTD